MVKYGRPKKSYGIKIWKHVNRLVIEKYTSQAEMAHAFNLNTREAEEGGSLRLWPAYRMNSRKVRETLSLHIHTHVYMYTLNIYHLATLL